MKYAAPFALLSLTAAIDIPCGKWGGREIAGREEYWCERQALRMHGKQAKDGTLESLIQNYENVFDEDLVDALKKEAKPYDNAAANFGSLKHGKRITFFMPFDAKPRTITEEAVLVLRDLVFPDGIGTRQDGSSSKVEGMKYWYQHRTADEDIGYHYDKDEGTASNQYIMRFPFINTLVYLTNEGAPTVFFNQTCIHNGNVPMPLVPSNGWLVYPKRNKWTLQRGDLLHGAQQNMAIERPSHGKPRITFVISFEDMTPVEPNCHVLTEDELPKSAVRAYKKLSPETLAKWRKPNPKFVEVEPETLDSTEWKANGDEDQRYVIHTGPGAASAMGEDLDIALPKSIKPRNTYFLKWHDKACLGVTKELDLNNDRLMDAVWKTKEPTGILFTTRGNDEDVRRIQLVGKQIATEDENAPESFLNYGRNMNFMHAFSDQAGDAMEAFGISEDDLPMAVVHNTVEDRKWVLPKEQGGAAMTDKSLYDFFKGALAGTVPEMVEEEDEEEGGEL